MRFIGILIICLLTFSVQAEIPSEYKRIIKEYKNIKRNFGKI